MFNHRILHLDHLHWGFIILVALLDFPTMALCEGVTLTLSGSSTVPSDVLLQLFEEKLACATDVVIEDGITGVDGYAFERIDDHLVSITIPASVTTLEPNILGTKGALAYTIYGDVQTHRPLLSTSNEDYGYFCTFEAAAPKLPDVPASALAIGIAQEMAGLDAEMMLIAAEKLSDNYGNVR